MFLRHGGCGPSAEVSLVRTYLLTGGPAPACGLEVGRGAAAFRKVASGGPVPLCSRPSPVRCEGGEFLFTCMRIDLVLRW